jgi:GT2 family glycosyltransferase
MSKLAIVIPVFNQWSYTKRALQDLAPLPEDHLIIVVDNGSTDETEKLNSSGKINVIRNKNNCGFGAASNQGYSKAVELGYANVMFLNNDIRVVGGEASWTAPLIRHAQDGYIVGPTAGCLDNNLNFKCEASKFPETGYGYLSGWNITASVETWKKLVLDGDEGPFSGKFFAYFEDTDLSLRALKLGIPLKIEKVPVRHIGRVTGKVVGISDLYIKSKVTFVELWGKK